MSIAELINWQKQPRRSERASSEEICTDSRNPFSNKNYSRNSLLVWHNNSNVDMATALEAGNFKFNDKEVLSIVKGCNI
jgi:hypothetical protein